MTDDLAVRTLDSETALAELFRQHRSGLAGAVRAMLGHADGRDEVLQDAFVRALRAWRRGERPREGASWIFVITINTARDRRRRLRRRGQIEQNIDDRTEREMPELTDTHGPAQRAADKEAVDAARIAIADLAGPEKDVFLLRVSGGLTFDATARALGIPIGTAKTRMRSALGRLRLQLASFAPDVLAHAATSTIQDVSPDR